MESQIDDALIKAFTETNLIEAYKEYKLKKWDRFSTIEDPEINIRTGADGVKFQAFEKQLYRNVKNISNKVIHDKYIFYPLREYNLPKPGRPGEYRVLSIGSIRDVLVQTILYDKVLYEPMESIFSELDYPEVISFAYRKGKSAPKAAKVINTYIQKGYQYAFDADLSKYFDTIPHERLMEKVEKIIGGKETITYKLLNRFVHTDRVLHDTYKCAKRKGKTIGYKVFHWKKPIRTHRKIGIPQGGVLSGMLANLYLHEFDVWVVNNLSKQIKLKYIRYADDFLILVKDKNELEIIHNQVKAQIELLGIKMNDSKTIKIDIGEKGLDFIGFNFDMKDLRVGERNVENFKNKVVKIIQNPPDDVIQSNNPSRTLKWLIWRINLKVQGYNKQDICPKCGANRNWYPRSWISFFQVVSDINQLREIDKWIREEIYGYMYKKHNIRIKREILHKMKLRSLMNEKHRIPTIHLKPCLCDIDEQGLWTFVNDIYRGKKFFSLAYRKPFFVTKVDNNFIYLRVGKNYYQISKGEFLRLWERLKTERYITRADLEDQGIKCTSQLVTLLSVLPGVFVDLWPIKLYFQGYVPAKFIQL